MSEISATPFSLPSSVPKPTLTPGISSGHVAWAYQLRSPGPPGSSFTLISTRPRVGSGKGADSSSGPDAPCLIFALQDTWLPQLVREESGFERGSCPRASLVPCSQMEHRDALSSASRGALPRPLPSLPSHLPSLHTEKPATCVSSLSASPGGLGCRKSALPSAPQPLLQGSWDPRASRSSETHRLSPSDSF